MSKSPEGEALTRLLNGYAGILRDRSIPVEERVEHAATLWEAIETAKSALEPFKEELRAKALRELKGQPGVSVTEGSGTSKATVVVGTSVLKPVENFDISNAQEVLGRDFPRLFNVTVTTRPDATTVAESLSPRHRKYLNENTTLVENPPRVSIRPIEGVDRRPTKSNR